MTLYSNGCPNCKKLKSELDKINLEYIEINDMEKFIENRFRSMPMLEIDKGEYLSFVDAMKAVKAYGK